MEKIDKKSKIYTRTGDQGTTRLVDGSCVEKFNPRVEAYGTVDELNSYIGIVRLHISGHPQENSFFETIRNHLFRIGSLLACSNEETIKLLPGIDEKHIELLELKIDKLDADLPELKQFILPSGTPASCHLQFARTLCRRAERRTAEVISIYDKNSKTLNAVLIYLNRLSDFLFVASRWFNSKSGVTESTWNKDI